jgi:hypothetical protein
VSSIVGMPGCADRAHDVLSAMKYPDLFTIWVLRD